MREVTEPSYDKESVLNRDVEGASANIFQVMIDPGMGDGLPEMGDYIWMWG